MFYGVINLDNGELKYTNAGHDFPFVVNGDGVEPLRESGIVLGCLEEFSYLESACTIPKNGTLVVYTDGVTESESRSGDYFGEHRLKATLEGCSGESAREICSSIVDEAKRFGSGENQDDITVLVLKRG